MFELLLRDKTNCVSFGDLLMPACSTESDVHSVLKLNNAFMDRIISNSVGLLITFHSDIINIYKIRFFN